MGVWVIEDDHDADLFGRIVAGRDWVVGLDVETRPEDGKRKTPKSWVDPLVGVGVSFYSEYDETKPEMTFYGSASDAFVAALNPALRMRPWYAHNAMFDATLLRRYGVILGEHIGDPRIIAYLLGSPEAGLKPLLIEHMNFDTTAYQSLLDEFDAKDLRAVPLERVADYCGGQDAQQVVLLERIMRKLLLDRSPRGFDVYTKIELPMVNLLVEMTYKGIRFDREAAAPRLETATRGRVTMDSLLAEMVSDTGFIEYEKRGGELWLPTCKGCRNGKLKRESCTECGGKGKLPPVPVAFNAGSWQQRGRFLYEHVGIPTRRFSGNVKQWEIDRGIVDPEELTGSTDALAMLQAQHLHPTIPVMLCRQGLAKDEGFLRKWIELSEKDGRLHSEFTNTTVASGRLSSREPNVQQITKRFRDLFLPDEGYEIVAGDMSQLELVISAFQSKDPVMCEIIRNGWDMHSITAEAIFGIPWREIPKDSPFRAIAKVVNYLSSYGGQKDKLIEGIEKLALKSPELGINVPSPAEAAMFIAKAKAKYQRYWAWTRWVVLFAQDNGYAETAYGRPRFFPDINSGNSEYRGNAERAAINHAIQGTAADLMKMAMVNIDRDATMSKLGYQCLQVHDEIVSIVHIDSVSAYSQRLRAHMELGQPFEPVVPLTVDVTHGPNWKDAHK